MFGGSVEEVCNTGGPNGLGLPGWFGIIGGGGNLALVGCATIFIRADFGPGGRPT